MEGYDATTYGAAFADVYDDWYAGISDLDATVAALLELAGAGPVLELAVGTGRLAVPLARAGAARRLAVTGIDASPEMLARLAARDPDRLVGTVVGDMVADLPNGPFRLAFIAYNSLFNLTEESAQAACFAAVASRLANGGRFVVEAFVPDEPFPDGDAVEIRSMTVETVVLSVTRNTAATQSAAGQLVEFAGRPGADATVRLRPWAIRYATPAQLDTMAAATGFTLEHRWEDFAGLPFTADSARHVSVYRLE